MERKTVGRNRPCVDCSLLSGAGSGSSRRGQCTAGDHRGRDVLGQQRPVHDLGRQFLQDSEQFLQDSSSIGEDT